LAFLDGEMPAVPLTHNLLIEAMPVESRERLAATGRVRELQLEDVPFEEHEVSPVVFPLDAVISLLRTLEDGTEIEVAMVGAEGVAGINGLLGVPLNPHKGLTQGRGAALFIDAAEMRNEMTREPRVVVFGQDGLSASYSVDTGGNITMPLIGAVTARGHTPAQLQAAIGAKLRQGFVREPHVAVEVEAYRPFFILGEVTLPGQYPYVANMTVETAVAIAGGYTPRAQKHRIAISRQVGGLTEQRIVSPNYPVHPGDTVKVAERWF